MGDLPKTADHAALHAQQAKEYPIAKVQGWCKWCHKELAGRRQYEPKFCSDRCSDRYERNTGATGKPGRPKGRKNDLPDQKVAKALAFDNLYDPVRDVVREEVRATISQHVKDNVLGMTEVLSDLLPLVFAGIAKDVQSDDVYVRQKAQGLILKYVMPLQNEETKADDAKTINIIHNVQLPNSPLGEAVEAELVSLPPGVEAFEVDWPVCVECGERKHPDNGRLADPAAAGGEQARLGHARPFMCNACDWRLRIKTGALQDID